MSKLIFISSHFVILQEDAVVQELSAANFFLVLKTGEIVTPSLERGTILPGVTRASVLDIVEMFHEELLDVVKTSTGNVDIERVRAVERDVYVKDMNNATEAFVTGTAAEIVPVETLGTGSKDKEQFSVEFKHGSVLPGGPVSKAISKYMIIYGIYCYHLLTWLNITKKNAI